MHTPVDGVKLLARRRRNIEVMTLRIIGEVKHSPVHNGTSTEMNSRTIILVTALNVTVSTKNPQRPRSPRKDKEASPQNLTSSTEVGWIRRLDRDMIERRMPPILVAHSTSIIPITPTTRLIPIFCTILPIRLAIISVPIMPIVPEMGPVVSNHNLLGPKKEGAQTRSDHQNGTGRELWTLLLLLARLLLRVISRSLLREPLHHDWSTLAPLPLKRISTLQRVEQ
jgi:hypothetical protein